MVMTDVGARCPACAPRRKLPQFEIGPLYLLRGIAGATVAGAALGALWGVLLPGGFAGFFMIFIGLGLGYGVAESVSLATNRKAGTPLQVAAALGVAIAYIMRNVVLGDALLPAGDLLGYVAAVVGIVFAINRLRV